MGNSPGVGVPPVAATSSASGTVLRPQDVGDSSSQSASVQRNTTEKSTSPLEHADRRSKLGLSVAVVRGPTMNNNSSTSTSPLSADDVDDQRDMSTAINHHHHHAASDASVSLAALQSVNDVQNVKETGELVQWRQGDLFIG